MTDNLQRVTELKQKLSRLQKDKDEIIKQIIPMSFDQVNWRRSRNQHNESLDAKWGALDHIEEEIAGTLSEYSTLSLALSEESLRRMATSSTRLEESTKRLKQFTIGLLIATIILVIVSMADLAARLGGHP